MPDEFSTLAKLMEKLCKTIASDGDRLLKPELRPPEEYSAVCCVNKLNTLFNSIVNRS